MAAFHDPDDPLVAPSEREYPESLEGYVLISETDLLDPNFYRTVVIMIQHNNDGAFGLVVNRKSDTSLGEAIDDLHETTVGEAPVFVGGPVQQEYLFVLHGDMPGVPENEHALRPAPGVVFEPASPELLSWLADSWETGSPADNPAVHFYAGYCGWGPGQLEHELREGSWLLQQIRTDIVFHPDPETAWKHALGQKGGFYRIVAETGFKPSMN